jgi:hypothetical protein
MVKKNTCKLNHLQKGGATTKAQSQRGTAPHPKIYVFCPQCGISQHVFRVDKSSGIIFCQGLCEPILS